MISQGLKDRLNDVGATLLKEDSQFINIQVPNKELINSELIDEIEFFTKKPVKVIEYRLNLNINSKTFTYTSSIDEVLTAGVNNSASDIHFEPGKIDGVIRFRVDGVLIDAFNIKKVDFPSIINQIKIKSNLDISEKRFPQDGRLIKLFSTGEVEFRVSIIPTVLGEKVVLRILNQSAKKLSIKKLDLNSSQITLLTKKLLNKEGLILISGPTGSGKTTTLYSILNELNSRQINILTVEDPIEYSLPGISQVQVNEAIGLSFPKILKSFLRQDPEVIMVGEIRDLETAKTAIRAALTGHLVLSTIHSNNSFSIFTRLVEMGIPIYQVKSALKLGVSQRLLRTFCKECNGLGCPKCLDSGFSGRKGVFEFFDPDQLPLDLTAEQINTININFSGGSLAQNASNILKNNETSKNEIEPFLI